MGWWKCINKNKREFVDIKKLSVEPRPPLKPREYNIDTWIKKEKTEVVGYTQFID